MKIGIVNDLPLAVQALRQALALQPAHQVIWVAANGVEAVERCARETPDLILMDLIMPKMSGVEATRRIMSDTPCAILIVTVSVGDHTSQVFEAMGHGALDAIDTPVLSGNNMQDNAAPLLAKINTIAKLINDKDPLKNRLQQSGIARSTKQDWLVGIGASAGGPAALATLLQDLPTDFPAAIVVVQHVDERFVGGMVDWLNQRSALPIRVANEGDQPIVGNVLIAGSNDHLRLKAADRLGYTSDPRDYVYRPSVDVFFHSICEFWRGSAIGVLLTGMGRDGATGLKALRNDGHYTIAQDQASSAVYGMPKAAAELNAAVDILPLRDVAHRLTTLV